MNLREIALLLLTTIIISVSAKNDRIKLRDVETLTLSSDKWTTSKRSAPVKQLDCSGYCSHKIQSAQCYNRGFDGNDVQWECKADMPSNYKFGRLEVSCEGYDYPDDDFILIGSCGLEYTIDKVSNSYDSSHQNYNDIAKDNNVGSSIMPIIFVICSAVVLYFSCRPNKRQAPEVNSNTGYGSSWFGNSSRPTAPPPPGFRADYCGTNDYDSYNTGHTSSGYNTNRPGFFSGMATGSLLGYLFGSRRNNTDYRQHRNDESSFWKSPSTSGYSSFGRSSTSHTSQRASQSTGFASTKRR